MGNREEQASPTVNTLGVWCSEHGRYEPVKARLAELINQVGGLARVVQTLVEVTDAKENQKPVKSRRGKG